MKNNHNHKGAVRMKGKIYLEMKYLRYLPILYALILFLIIGPIIIPSTLFAETMVSGHIGMDTTWTKTGSPYIVTDDVSVYGDSTNAAILTIQAGVEVRFDQGKGLIIGTDGNQGGLDATGAEDDLIRFTANAETPNQGYWQSIRFDSGTINTSTKLEYCIVEYAGYDQGAGIYLNSASPTIKNCQIRKVDGSGIYCKGYSSPNIESSNISDNSQYGIYCHDTASAPMITSNIISNNGSYPLGIPVSSLYKMNNNIFAGNGNQAILLWGGRISQDTICRNIGIPYVFTSHVSVYGDNTNVVHLIIEHGVEIQFCWGAALSIEHRDRRIQGCVGGRRDRGYAYHIYC